MLGIVASADRHLRCNPAPRSAPLFTFGVIADVQWMDADDGWNFTKTIRRSYRGALEVLSMAVDWWCDMDRAPKFIAQLGDLIDGQNADADRKASDSALREALVHLDRAPCPSVNLIGNHELYDFSRPQLAKLLDTAPRTVGAGGRADGKVGGREYYAFVPQLGWRFLILDPYQESIIGYPPNDQRRKKAEALVVSRNPNVDPVNPAANGNWLAGMARGDPDRRFVPYNGGIHHCPYPLRKAQSCVAPGLSS